MELGDPWSHMIIDTITRPNFPRKVTKVLNVCITIRILCGLNDERY